MKSRRYPLPGKTGHRRALHFRAGRLHEQSRGQPMRGFTVRLTHSIMAIGVIGLTGLLTVGAIYEAGSRSQDASRATAMHARAIAELNKQISIEMLEARRNEKNFQARRNESYATAHAELVVVINRDFDRLAEMTKAAGMNALAEKT